MARRGGGISINLGLKSLDLPCGVEGCKDTYLLIYTSTTKKERREEIARKKARAEEEKTNFCLKHMHLSQVPSPSTPHLETTYVVVMRTKPGYSSNGPKEPTLVPADDPVEGKPLRHSIGPGYYLYPDELPINARVTFSVDVVIPEEPEEGTVEL